MSFHSRLKEARENRKLTQKELAKIVGINERTLGGYEADGANSREPTVNVLSKLIAALEIDANWLFQDEVQVLDEMALTFGEAEGIKKYRELSDIGKEAVRTTLDREYKRDQLTNAKVLKADKAIL